MIKAPKPSETARDQKSHNRSKSPGLFSYAVIGALALAMIGPKNAEAAADSLFNHINSSAPNEEVFSVINKTPAKVGQKTVVAPLTQQKKTISLTPPVKAGNSSLDNRIAQLGNINGVSNKVIQGTLHYMLYNEGLSPCGAGYLIANFIQESGLRPNAVGDGGAAKGLAQWHSDRRAGMPTKADSTQELIDEQIHWMLNTEAPRDGRVALRYDFTNPNTSVAKLQADITKYERYAPNEEGIRFSMGSIVCGTLSKYDT